jgi:hypothetical protein
MSTKRTSRLVVLLIIVNTCRPWINSQIICDEEDILICVVKSVLKKIKDAVNIDSMAICFSREIDQYWNTLQTFNCFRWLIKRFSLFLAIEKKKSNNTTNPDEL